MDDVIRYRAFVHHMVQRTAPAALLHDPVMGYDDMVGAAWLGLVEALRRYDDGADRPAFISYAYGRVRGEIIDHIRRTAPVTRTGHYRPSPAPEPYVFESYSDGTEGEGFDEVERRIDAGLAFARLMPLLNRLSVRDRWLLALYYRDGLTMEQIGALMSLGLARISQIHRRILDDLRALAKETEHEDDRLAVALVPG